MGYSPLTDTEWSRIEHLFDVKATNSVGRPRRNPRPVIDAILWIETTGEKWHRLPQSFPPAQTCYLKWLTWNKSWLMAAVRKELRIFD
jgi:transposase